jgi:hypothetical protein
MPVKINEKKRPISIRKVEANRKNALKSTGPKTLIGKKHSRKNAVKHGLFAKSLFNKFIAPFENPQEFQELTQLLWQQYQPEGKAEELEVEHIALCWWKRQRVWRCENAEFLYGIGELGRGFRASTDRQITEGKMMTPEQQALSPLLADAEKEIEASGEISKELQEKLFAADPSFLELWAIVEKVSTEIFDKSAAQQTGMSLPVVREYVGARPDFHAQRARTIALAGVRFARQQIDLRARQTFESLLDVAIDRAAIPNTEALNKILRYEAAIDRQLGRTVDRLERLQRRRQGEMIPPPLTVHLSR